MSVLIAEFVSQNALSNSGDDSDESSKKWIDVNRKYAEVWPNVLNGRSAKDEMTGKILMINLKSTLATGKS